MGTHAASITFTVWYPALCFIAGVVGFIVGVLNRSRKKKAGNTDG